MTLYTKRQFIKAYSALCGVSEVDARRVWKEKADDVGYVSAIIKAFEDEARKSFYCD